MAALPPTQVEIGTRGTIASLVSQEIEYFKRLEVDRKEKTSKPRTSPTPKKKKKTPKKAKSSGGGSNSSFIPSICSAVEIPETSYRNLRTEGNKFPREC